MYSTYFYFKNRKVELYSSPHAMKRMNQRYGDDECETLTHLSSLMIDNYKAAEAIIGVSGLVALNENKKWYIFRVDKGNSICLATTYAYAGHKNKVFKPKQTARLVSINEGETSVKDFSPSFA